MLNKINDTTYQQTVKDNPKDRIEFIVGDDKQPDFKPQFKIQRWSNEVNFSIRAEEKVGATLEEKDGIIKYITQDYEVHQYEKPEAGEDGGFEFEWVLKSKPATNVLEATIQSKGVDFFYQPALTQQEIDEGASRPDNVIGSYAVYHSIKGGLNDSAGMEYKVGKVCHIYRPKAIDKNGKETWCDLNIDEQSGILTVTVPQKFLDTAVYPVKVDPTFGLTGIGGTAASNSNKSGTLYSLSEDGDVTKISMYTGTISTQMQTGIYDGSAGDITDQQAVSSLVTPTSLNWWDFTTTVSLTSGSYFIVARRTTVTNFTYYYDTGGADTQVFGPANGTVFADPWEGTESYSNRQFSIYATYTASGGGGAIQSNLLLTGVG